MVMQGKMMVMGMGMVMLQMVMLYFTISVVSTTLMFLEIAYH